MISYERFRLSDDHTENLLSALRYCREHGEDGIRFEKGTYDFYPDRAQERVMHVSNHDINGLYRIAFLLEGMRHFTVDGGGSRFVFYGAILPFAILHSEDITVKDLTVDFEGVFSLEVSVEKVAEDHLDLEIRGDETYRIDHGQIYVTTGTEELLFPYCDHFYVRGMNGQHEYLPIARDISTAGDDVRFEALGERRVRMYQRKVQVEVGTDAVLNFRANRQSCNIAIAESRNVSVLGVTMHRGCGMGILAQKTENVTVDRMTVAAREGYLNAMSADATHFVHCKGLVKVTNSDFREQLDDALNIHGIFTKIIDKTEDSILVRYMHPQAQGINVYDKGDRFQTLPPNTLIPNGEYEIADVDVINQNLTRIFVEGGTEGITVGDLVEDLTWSCDLLFENNRVYDNRARGMLIAAKGSVTVRNNYFHSPGMAILFESDGKYWFESGGTRHVEILGNTFDACKFSVDWGRYVICFKPREERTEGKFYHGYVRIAENRFVNNSAPLLYADNVEELVFENNIIEGQKTEELVTFGGCGRVLSDV